MSSYSQPTLRVEWPDSSSAGARGVHHIAFEVDDLQASLDALNEHGVRTIDNAPREGLSGMIGFIHPRSTRGVLIELVDQDTARR